ncbi:MAG: T9SS type A sorting domain-containing protein [Cytophagales bacterium]|nr:T9SS type A sorting domain-containing protein [Cytophagales bacterium]
MRKIILLLTLIAGTMVLIYKVQDVSDLNQKIVEKKETVKQEKGTNDPYQDWLDKKTAKKKMGIAKADQPEMHGIIQRQLRTRDGDDGPKYGPNQVMEEYAAAKKRSSKNAARTENMEFIERGPGNVGGRTRGLVIDPDDPNQETFYAGSASGGIWKTTDNGANWSYLSDDIPNLGTNTLVMAPSNTDVMYAGTGEHFTNDIDGAGLFKSTDRGNSWTQIADPSDYPDFRNVSRIVVDPNDENTVIATTRSSVWGPFSSAIYKTEDGGSTWTQLRSSTNERHDDIDYDPSDFSTLYVAINGVGVIKSTDEGLTWEYVNNGLSPGGRVEITVSPVNTNRIWASSQGSVSGTGSDLYVSNDGGANWFLAINESGTNEDFLGGQGWYDNIITPHPYDANKVYVGGVNTFLFELAEGDAEDLTIIAVNYDAAPSFMNFVNFTGNASQGFEFGGVAERDLLPVEVRFGQGTQMAHRFSVGGQGPGVAAEDYIYEDYVEVPFQVWDTRNDVQLMASFRDQQEDGTWNLIATNTDGAGSTHSREYLYIHNIPYSETAADTITQDGGHENGQMYFFWTTLAAGATFDPDDLPESQLAVVFNVTPAVYRNTTVVSDAYNAFNGINSFPQSTRAQGLHPDQHNYVVYDKNDDDQTFRILVGNDGGVYTTERGTSPGPAQGDFNFISNGYNTTQFYGADKAPGENRFIGGTQDNGTWYHPDGTEGGADVNAVFGIGGDGFEALWHSSDPDKIIGGSQFNGFSRTLDGGETWIGASNGFDDDGPFITRLAHHKQLPDRIFTTGATGVWFSNDFGGEWSAATMNNANTWSFSNAADVEVSYANPDVIWAGGRLNEANRLHVSTDGGQTFNETENYDVFNMGSVAGIGTHPTEENTAYALFSFAGFPKVLKTTDLGETWEDISGFDGSGAASSKGFPDVAVNCLFVFPSDNNRIWVGSEIGIIESLDGGESWNLMENNMPPVNVYDFKLAENQLVIATYGRGIWSVELEGIVIAPIVEQVYVEPTGGLNFNFNFSEAFDSIQVFLEGEIIGTIYDNEIGSLSQVYENRGLSGNRRVNLSAYLDGQIFTSVERLTFMFEPTDISGSYGTNFSASFGDFIGSGLQIRTEEGFEARALHSPHPYGDAMESVFYLRVPIEVAASDATLTYEDVALIEPGEDGTEFGDFEFWDYVVVEASSDGLNWIPLEDGYDARRYPEWLAAYEAGENGTSELFQSHSINLLDHFNAGDNILIRFRMFADANTNGFGWVVDDFYIQDIALSAEKELSSKITISPNPVESIATIQLGDLTPSRVEIIDLNGRVLQSIQPKSGSREIQWNRGNLKGGLYIARFEIDGQLVSKKFVLN